MIVTFKATILINEIESAKRMLEAFSLPINGYARRRSTNRKFMFETYDAFEIENIQHRSMSVLGDNCEKSRQERVVIDGRSELLPSFWAWPKLVTVFFKPVDLTIESYNWRDQQFGIMRCKDGLEIKSYKYALEVHRQETLTLFEESILTRLIVRRHENRL